MSRPLSPVAIRDKTSDDSAITNSTLPSQAPSEARTSGSACNTGPSYLQQFSSLNKWEKAVPVDKFSVLDDPLLRKTPYIINTQYHILICTDCKFAVSVKSAVSHARKDHSFHEIPGDLERKLSLKYPLLVSESIQPSDTCHAIFGIAIPSNPFLICSRCRRGYVNAQSWRNHSCKNPQVDLKGGALHFPSLVQTVFPGNKTCYFPIHTPASYAPPLDDFNLFKAQLSTSELAVDEVVENANYREMHQFLCKEGWISHVAGCTISKVVALVALPSIDDPLREVAPALEGLLSNIQAIISKGVFHLRRLLGRRPSYVF